MRNFLRAKLFEHINLEGIDLFRLKVGVEDTQLEQEVQTPKISVKIIKIQQSLKNFNSTYF